MVIFLVKIWFWLTNKYDQELFNCSSWKAFESILTNLKEFDCKFDASKRSGICLQIKMPQISNLINSTTEKLIRLKT